MRPGQCVVCDFCLPDVSCMHILAGDRNSPEVNAKRATASRPWHANHFDIMHHVIECITVRIQWVDAAVLCNKQRWPSQFCKCAFTIACNLK